MKRICLLLDKDLQQLFTNEAHKRGITKSALLKKLIRGTHTEYINYQNYQKKNILYNFRVSDETYQKLIHDSITFKVTLGEYLRSIIFQSSLEKRHHRQAHGKITIANSPNTLFTLWRSGNYSAINSTYSNLEKLTNLELLYYANANIEIGMNLNAQQSLDFLEGRYKSMPAGEILRFTKVSHLIQADMAIRNRELTKAENHLAIAGSISLAPLVRTYWGYYYCLMGEVAEYKDQIDLSFRYYEKALEYLDIVHHAWFMMRIYIRIARSWKYKAYYNEAQRFLSKAFEINKKVNNVYYDAWNHMDLSFYYFVTLHLNDSIENTKKAIRLYNMAGNRRGSYYGIDNLGRVELEKGNIDQSYKYFKKAREIEKTFRPKDSMSSTDFYLSFIEARDNYKRSKHNFEEYAKGEKANVWPTFHQYFQGATQYLCAPTSEERRKGAVKLKKLSHESQNVLVAEAASNTLKHKRVMPIR